MTRVIRHRASLNALRGLTRDFTADLAASVTIWFLGLLGPVTPPKVSALEAECSRKRHNSTNSPEEILFCLIFGHTTLLETRYFTVVELKNPKPTPPGSGETEAGMGRQVHTTSGPGKKLSPQHMATASLRVHLVKPLLSFGSGEHLRDKLLNQRAEIQGSEISAKKAGLAANTGGRRSRLWFLASLPEPRLEMN
jgi:hypothetical protein